MATRHQSTSSYHECTCGETFDSTDELLDHAREDHGLGVY